MFGKLLFAAAAACVALPQANAQSPVSQAVFDKIIRYTAFAAASYADDCLKPAFGSSVVKYFNDNASDTQATLFRDDKAREVVIAFRGTSSPPDLDSDFRFSLVPLATSNGDCPSCKVHQGFQQSFASIGDTVTATIQNELSSNSGYKLIVTGHSLGAGIAAIATASLKHAGVRVSEAYTFGEPRNGDSAWASYFASQFPDKNYYRVTHFNDGVPQIPPTVLGYAHHGPEYFQSKDANNTAATTLKCQVDSPSCSAGQDYGNSPINRAHLTYSNTVLGSSLFIPGCGAVFP